MSSDPGWWARKLGGQPAQPQQVYVPQGLPQPQQQGRVVYQEPQSQQAPQLTTENLFEMAAYWTGGEGHRQNPYACPSCGGNHYYSRAAEVSRGPAPAPMCFDCGYNGMFQQGDPATWQAGSA